MIKVLFPLPSGDFAWNSLNLFLTVSIKNRMNVLFIADIPISGPIIIQRDEISMTHSLSSSSSSCVDTVPIHASSSFMLGAVVI